MSLAMSHGINVFVYALPYFLLASKIFLGKECTFLFHWSQFSEHLLRMFVCVQIPHSQERLNVKVDVLKEARGNIYQEHQRFLQTFDAAWRTDESIMLLLGAITLFTPDRLHVVHQDVIKLEQVRSIDCWKREEDILWNYRP